jgi:V/A-type H+/Na+-transporting ATPase subunit K
MFTAAVLVFLGASISALFGFIGSTIGMGNAGRASTAILAERPELFGKIMIMTALPGSQGIYGFVGAFLILNASGLMGGADAMSSLTVSQGLQYLIVGIPIGISGLLSGIYQGLVAANGITTIAKDDTLSGKAIILAALVETWAIFGLLIGFILLGLV